MTEPANERRPRDAAFWARSGNALRLSGVPEDAVNLNVEGLRIVGPLHGFGKMWRKTYKVRPVGARVAPADVVKVWKEDFPKFWERGNRFYAPATGIAAGDVVLINNSLPGGARISTGILVLYADDESFTFMTPEGHPFSGWITFSAFEEDGVTAAQVQMLVRASDPVYEMGMSLGLHGVEDKRWQQTLASLAAHFGVRGRVETTSVCVDPGRQWSRAGNIRHNAVLRSAFHAVTSPLRRRREVILAPGQVEPGGSVTGIVLRDGAPGETERKREPRDAAYWARGANALRVRDVPEGAVNLNVEGRRVVGALQGFGQLWRKTYRVELIGAPVTPADVVKVWKERFPEFNPPQSRFYPSLDGVAPGEVVLINLSLRGMPVHTGVRVIYADEESFTVMTPEGHPESGWNTFSAYRDGDGRAVAQVQSLARATDPIYEIGFRLFGSTEQERIWTHTLESLAAHFGVNGAVKVEKVCIDPTLQWSQLPNLWHNAGIRSVFYTVATPLRPRRRSDQRPGIGH